MPRHKATDATDLSQVTTASRAAECIAVVPTRPVVIHWQKPNFPSRIAKKLLAQRGHVLWVVATSERGDIAERELLEAGIAVARVRTETHDTDTDYATLSPIELVRRTLKRKEAYRETRYPQPPSGTITIVPFGRLGHRLSVDEIARWESPLVVFDHVGVVCARWLEAEFDEEASTAPVGDKYTTRPDSHPIPVFHQHEIPLVFITRDNLELELHRGYFGSRGTGITTLVTSYAVPKHLRIAVVGTSLAWTRYAAGAFLSVLASVPDATVVGEALIGGITPDKLSMSTITPLNKAVLRVAHTYKPVLELDQKQTGLPEDALATLRMRDFIRTATLAVDPATRSPELTILCPTNMASAVASYAGVVAANLPNWNPNRPQQAIGGSPFTGSVIRAASTYPTALAHRARQQRISSLLRRERSAKLPGKMGRLALALHCASGEGEKWDLAGRPEEMAGTSKLGDGAIAVFNTLLDEVFEWSAKTPKHRLAHLHARQETFRRYRKLRDRVLGANKDAAANAVS